MKTSIYYFTGTGNCLDVARDIKNLLGETEVIFMPSLAGESSVKPHSERVGFIFPVYDYGLPIVVRDFLKRFDITGVKYSFAVATCNFLPGLALENADEILKEKGGRLNSGFIIRMPGNYLPMYGANSQKTQEKKFRQKTAKVSLIADHVRECRDEKLEKSRFIIDRILAPTMQKYIEKFPEMDKDFRVDDKCNGCSICKSVCAFDNIQLIDGKPYWKHNCQQCFACIHLCPKTSLQIGEKTMHKKRYKNPHITLADLINQTHSP